MSSKSGKKNLLIVDDVPDNIKVLGEVLKDDYDITIATGGEKALKIAMKKAQPDLILLDIIMPEMDGYEVCSRLKAYIQTRNIPIIFITSRDDDIDEIKGLELGAADFITKPFRPAIIKARIRTQLEIVHLRKQLEDVVKDRTETLLDILREKLNPDETDRR